MPDEKKTVFVCPECDKVILRPATELLTAMSVTCDYCGHEVTLDRRLPKKDGGEE